MIGRRAFMAALGLAPVAAKAKLEDMSMMGNQRAIGVADQIEPSPPDPISEAAYRYMRRKANRLENRFHQTGQHLPPAIAGKKSWSPVFKVHAFEEDKARHEDALNMWDMDREQIIKLAMKYGWKG